MKRLLELLEVVLLDRGTWCDVCTDRDFKRVTSRVEHEGLSFLTITLPKFGSDFEKSLDQGFVSRSQFRGFPKTGRIPAFLQGFVGLVFDRKSGVLLNKPSIDAIQAVRQITLMFGKMDLPCSDARERAAMRRFVECEQELVQASVSRNESKMDQFARLGRMLWADVLADVDLDVYEERLVPKHGPGATADKLTGNGKYNQTEWPQRLDAAFPLGDYLVSNPGDFQSLDPIQLLEPGAERPVKVISVPKTQKTPRIIAIEPAAMQYTQQALLASLVRRIERNDPHSFGKLLGFSDQTPNNRLAQEGSLSGELATLDLSEASDRVSYQHVRLLLANHPHLARAVDACRSRNADVLGHGIIPLTKFASMGSALCFPFEAMVFATIILCGVEDARGQGPLTRQEARSLVLKPGKVRVYGDDIIVPVEYVDSVILSLEAHGLIVNKNKSFWTGKFRESCGKEYYDGHDVSVVRVRRMLPTSQRDAPALVSLAALRNQMYYLGYWEVCKHLDNIATRYIPWPVVMGTSAVLGRHSYLGYETQRECPRLHRPLVRGMVVRTKLPSDKLDGVGALLKCLLHLEYREPNESAAHTSRRVRSIVTSSGQADHLVRSGRSQAIALNLRWAPPY